MPISMGGLQSNATAERETCDMTGKIGLRLSEELHDRQRVVHLTVSAVMLSFAQPRAAEIEAQHLAAKSKKSFGCGKDDLVMHGSLVKGMRMTNNSQSNWLVGLAKLQKSFETSCGTGDLDALNFGHVIIPCARPKATTLSWFSRAPAL